MSDKKLQKNNKLKLIFDFITENMTSYDLSRNDDDAKWKFVDEYDSDDDSDVEEELNYDAFKKFQLVQLESLSEPELFNLVLLMNMINNGISIMDKECMVAFDSSGFCFDKNGKLVIFNER